MEDKHYLLIRWYLWIRATVMTALVIALSLLVLLVVREIADKEVNESVTTVLGIGIGGVVSAMATIASSLGRDILEYLFRNRES